MLVRHPRTIDFADLAGVTRHDQVVRRVEQLLALHEQRVLAAQVVATDRPLTGWSMHSTG